MSMSNTVSFAELDGQHVELLPVRTVLSMLSTQGPDGAIPGDVTPRQFAQGTLGLVGVGSMSPGPDGSNADGITGADKS